VNPDTKIETLKGAYDADRDLRAAVREAVRQGRTDIQRWFAFDTTYGTRFHDLMVQARRVDDAELPERIAEVATLISRMRTELEEKLKEPKQGT